MHKDALDIYVSDGYVNTRAVLAILLLLSAAGFRAFGQNYQYPVPIERPAPRYSSEALRIGIRARVTVRLMVNARGEPEDIQVTRPAGFGLDAQRVGAAQRSAVGLT